MSSAFEYSNLESWLTDELTLRESNTNSVEEPYRKPLATWMRFISNNRSRDGLNGFIMTGGKTFDDTYGFGANLSSGTVLGKTIDGQDHILKDPTDWKHRPSPGVTDIQCDLTGGDGGKFNTCKVSWKCWSPDQFDYLVDYFMNPGATCLVEWGWENCPVPPIDERDSNMSQTSSDTGSLEYKESQSLLSLWESSDAIKKRWKMCKGRSEFVLGMISNFEFSMNENGGFDVVTTVMQQGIILREASTQNPNATDEDGKRKNSLKEWVDRIFDKLNDSSEDPIPGLSTETIKVKRVNSDGNYELVDFNPSNESIKWKKQIFSFKNYKSQSTLSPMPFEAPSAFDKEYYVRFSVVVDIINSFFADKNQQDKGLLFRLNSSGIRICASPNLKSTNQMLFIPNAKAPIGYCYNKLNVDENGFDGFFGTAASDFKEADQTLNYCTNGIIETDNGYPYRVDLFDILKKGLSGDVDTFNIKPFPNYYYVPKENEEPNFGYFGMLDDLFIRSDMIKKSLTVNEKMVDGLKELLREISGAACGIWNFDVLAEGNANGDLWVVDKTYKGSKSIDSIIKDQTSQYTFKFGTYKSIVKAASLNGKLPDRCASQVIARNYKDQTDKSKESNGTKDFSNMFYCDDRILKKRESLAAIETADSKIGSDRGDDRTDKAWQKEDLIFKVQTTDDKGQPTNILVRLLERDVPYQYQLINDGHPQNSATSNSPIPGMELELTILGVSGFKMFNIINFDGLPKKLYGNGVFSVRSVSHSVTEAGWITTLKCQFTTKNGLP